MKDLRRDNYRALGFVLILIEVELLIKVNFLRSRLFTFLDHALFYILVYFMVIKVVFEYHFEAFIKIKVLLNLG